MNMNRNITFLAAAVLAFLTTMSLAAENPPARHVASDTEFWISLEKAVSATLLPISPDIDAFRLDLTVRRGDLVCGSGTISLKKNDHTLLSLSAKGALFRYLAVGATATCLLDLDGEQTLFVSGPDRQVPVPTVRVDRTPEGDFSMNIMMNLAVSVATRPIEIGVHPRTPAHIVKKLRETHPWCLEMPAELCFAKEQNASPTVILNRHAGLITGFELVFPGDGAPTLSVRADPLAIGNAAERPDIQHLFPAGRIPGPGADTLITFLHGFYKVLSEMIRQ